MAAANRHVTSPADLRAHDTAVANIFTEAATSRAQAGDPATALACQWVGDIHRVTAALWARVSAHADPHQEFFSLAEQVLMAADQVPTGNGSTASVLLAELRSAFSQACTMLNVPLVFPAAGHLTPLTQLVDLNDLRGQVLGGMEPDGYVTYRLTGAHHASPAGMVRMALEAYVVDVAERAGDVMLLTAAARLVAFELNAPRTGDDRAVLVAVAQRILGPIEWVRAGEYLQRAGAV